MILEEKADFWLNMKYSNASIYQEKLQKILDVVLFTEVLEF